jgi:hypothetical protein
MRPGGSLDVRAFLVPNLAASWIAALKRLAAGLPRSPYSRIEIRISARKAACFGRCCAGFCPIDLGDAQLAGEDPASPR